MILARIALLVRKQEKTGRSDLQKETETCEGCAAKIECLAEFNGQQVCSRCFEQMIQIRVSGRKDRKFGSDFRDHTCSPTKEEEQLLAV
jgi:hypothetical protein